MGIQIVGNKNNVSAGVSSAGKLETESITLSSASYINLNFERSYTIVNTLTPQPSADFFYIKNEEDYPLVLVSTQVWCASDEKITFWRNPTGNPTGGSEISPANCYFGSNVKPTGFFYVGENIDGLSDGEKRNIIRLKGGVQTSYEFLDWTILPKNATFKAKAETGGSELDIWFQLFYAIGIS